MTPFSMALIVATAWAAYFFMHSALASPVVKRAVARRWPAAKRYYRFAYNAASVLLLLPLLWAVLRLPSPTLWQFTGVAGWVADGAALAAAGGFLWTARYYRMDEFMGTLQWRQGENDAPPGFVISPLHRFVRHPWYALGLVILWTRDMDLLRLVSAVMISGYLVIGSRLEERKLLVEFGEGYREYMRRVPGLIPRPWRYLTRRDTEHLFSRHRPAGNLHSDRKSASP